MSGLGEPCNAEAAETMRDRRRVTERERDLHRRDKGVGRRGRRLARAVRGELPRRADA
jgi:hypothetical protein